MPRRRAVTRIGAVPAAALVAVAAGAVLSGGSEPASERAAAPAPPAPLAPAFTPGAPRPLGSTRHLSHWAPVLHRTRARIAPDPAARVTARVSTRTPEGTRNVVGVIARRADQAGRRWVRVRLPALPNGTSGWVRRAALGGYGTVATRLDVDVRALRATLYRAGRAVLRAPVAVGRPGWPTPRGTFDVRNKLTRYRSPDYGPVAFGTSARSPRATDWPAGGFVGIHGTDRPDLVPGRVSHGCIRMRNRDILQLARLMPVGTPVTVR